MPNTEHTISVDTTLIQQDTVGLIRGWEEGRVFTGQIYADGVAIARERDNIQLEENFVIRIEDSKYSSLQCVVECWECIYHSRIDNQDDYFWCNRCGMEVSRRGFCYHGRKGAQR